MTTWRPPGEKFIGVAAEDKRGLLGGEGGGKGGRSSTSGFPAWGPLLRKSGFSLYTRIVRAARKT